MDPTPSPITLTPYRDGWRARFQYRGARPAAYFPHDAESRQTGQPSVAMQAAAEAWAAQKRLDLETAHTAYGDAMPAPAAHRPAQHATMTLDEHAVRFYPQITTREQWKTDRSHLRAVLNTVVQIQKRSVRLGDLAPPQLTTELLNLAVAVWRERPTVSGVRRVRVAAYERDGVTMPAYERSGPITSGVLVAPRTVRHRLRMIRQLLRAVAGGASAAVQFVKDVHTPTVKRTPPAGIDAAILIAVAHRLAQWSVIGEPPQGYGPTRAARWRARAAIRTRRYLLAYARHVVLATTGQRPCQLMTAQPDDVNLAARTWFVREAKFEPAHLIKLTDVMEQAWRAFIAAKAWGAYNTTTHANHVHRAGLPHGVKPYNARHAVLITALQKGANLGDVAGFAGHLNPNTTRQHYAGVQMTGQEKVAAVLEGHLAEMFTPRLVKKS